MTKRASLTLRKPGAVDPSAMEAFVEGGAGAGSVTPIHPEVPTIDEPVVEAQPKAPPTRRRAKQQVEIDEVPTFRRARKSLAKRKTKEDRRRTTVYMRLDLARKVASQCDAQEMDMSDVVNAALEKYFSRA